MSQETRLKHHRKIRREARERRKKKEEKLARKLDFGLGNSDSWKNLRFSRLVSDLLSFLLLFK